MRLFNRLFQGLFLLIVGANILLYATGTEIRIITDDKTSPSLENRLGATEVVGLSAHFTNSTLTVNNYIIKSLPDASLGILYMPDKTTAVVVGEHLIQSDADSLFFDPIESCTSAEATFTYVGVSTAGVEGTFATVTVPLTVAEGGCIGVISDDKLNADIINTLGATDIVDLSGTDSNGESVSCFIIASLPTVNQGILFMPDGTTAIRLGQVLSLRESNGIKFDPNVNFVGDVEFTYVAIDDNGIHGDSAIVTIPVIDPPIVAPTGGKPIADDKQNSAMLNTLGAVNILDLSGKDGNGDGVKSFIIASLPSVNQGILYMLDGTTAVNLNQTLTLEEANGLKFDPNANFVGEVTFTYLALDSNGIRSNPATVTIPLIAPTGTGKPTADDKHNPEMLNSLGAVNILDLSGKDGNGNGVDGFIITSLPTANQGILYMADGTTAVTLNQALTQDEANGLKFDPSANFVGDVTFTYQSVDANGVKSLDATVTIPLVNPVAVNAPTADSKRNPEMLNTLGAVNILDLSGKDSSGKAVDSFVITSLPPVNQGVLYMADATTAVKLNQTLTLEEANGLKFDPSVTFIGDVTFTYVAVDSSGLQSANATVTIPLIASHNTDIVANDDEGRANGNADPITINVLANDTGTLEGATIHLIDNNGDMQQEITITGEGVWSVNEENSVIFTPIAPFVGTPSSITYLVQDPNGAVSNTATVNISGQCVCKAYREDIAVFSTLGLLLMFLFSAVLGSILIKREI